MMKELSLLPSKKSNNALKKFNQKPLKQPFQRLFAFLFVSLCLLIISIANPLNHSYALSSSYEYPIIPTGGDNNEFTEDFMKINIKGSIVLRQNDVDALQISELSDIAWDEDEQLLYAVSNEGLLFHFKLGFTNNSKKSLISMHAVYGTRLKDNTGYKLQGKYSDSEGLSLIKGGNGKKGDSKLIISFENKPRIAKYSTTGKMLEDIKIPRRLRKRKTYRSKNKALESVIKHPQYGILTAAEYPVEKDDMKYQTLYAVSKKQGRRSWHFKASNATNSAVTSLEVLNDGSVLILERAYQNPITPVIINLRRLRLDKCDHRQECETETIASFDGSDGWLLDNFEGLTHLRGNEYLMVSDDNRNVLQKTILLHFEIKQ